MDRVFVWNEKASAPVGPFDRKTISNLVEKGVVRRETLVAADGEQEWSNAASHPMTACCLAPESSCLASAAVAPRPEELRKANEGRVRHAAYDPDFDLEILDLNPGTSGRHLRDYALLAGAVNLLALGGLVLLPFNPLTLTLMLTLFVGGNVSLAWIYGVVLR